MCLPAATPLWLANSRSVGVMAGFSGAEDRGRAGRAAPTAPRRWACTQSVLLGPPSLANRDRCPDVLAFGAASPTRPRPIRTGGRVLRPGVGSGRRRRLRGAAPALATPRGRWPTPAPLAMSQDHGPRSRESRSVRRPPRGGRGDAFLPPRRLGRGGLILGRGATLAQLA